MTAKGTWKAFERYVAALFGTVRTPLSGGASRHTKSDTLHPELYIEIKYRDGDILKAWARRELEQSAESAAEEGKRGPILAFKRKFEPDDDAIAVVPLKWLSDIFAISFKRSGGRDIVQISQREVG